MTDKRIKSYLKDRLKRLESIRNERELTTAELGDIACCKQTLAFIDSMQENPCDGCTNRKGCITCENGELMETELSHSDVTKISDQEEPASKDLETSIIEYMNHVPENEPESSNTLYTYEQMQDIARHFAEWHKRQMMKDAVDGEVTHGKSLAIPSLGYFLDKNGLEFGDKVKLIIIKEG